MAGKKSQQRKKEGEKKKKKEEENKKKEEEPYMNEVIEVEETGAKDFSFLANAPVYENNFFIPPSEKDWTIDTSKYSEYFTLDLKILAAAIGSIPFNENVNIGRKYLTDDQLTSIHNVAEQAKQRYNEILGTLESEVSNEKENEETRDSEDDTTEDLDFLLSLNEPEAESVVTMKSISTSSKIELKDAAPKSNSKPSKSIDLEKWLDSVLVD